jgi:hypothetical protein
MNYRSTLARIALLSTALAISACSSDEDDPMEPETTPAVVYSASVSETRFSAGYSLLVTLSIENISLFPVTLTYPASCPIRIRLYEPADNAPVYDETRVICPFDGQATLTISPGATRTIGSGFRAMVGIVGDSLRFATYRVFAVPQMEGSGVVEVPAGSVTLKQ